MSYPINALRMRNPSVAATDPNFSSVKLLTSGDGANGSQTFTDESPAAHGNSALGATVDTATVKFGTGSVKFGGSADYLEWANSTDWQLSNGAFTIEGWFNFFTSGIETTQTLVSLYNTNSNQRSWALTYRGGDATNVLRLEGSSAGSAAVVVVASSAWTPTAGQWYHIVVERSGNVFRIYVDGVMIGSATDTITLFNSTATLRFGCLISVVATQFFWGWMDEPRITKGVARYASDSGYVVPTATFPRA